jgi:Fe-S cluster assembly iron-binding protein IscA
LIAELVNQTAMEKLLHDSYANYVVQTSLDFADEDQRAEVIIKNPSNKGMSVILTIYKAC